MFAPRSFMDENAVVSQTPGPRRARAGAMSPLKGHMTTAGKTKKAAFDENQFASPKRLFGDAKSPQKGGATPGPSRRPMKGSPTKAGPSGASNALRAALGDKTNNNKTPALRTGRPGRVSPTDGSPHKKSPIKGKKPLAGKVPITPGALKLPKSSAFRTPVGTLEQRAMLRQRTGDIQRPTSVAPVEVETADGGAEVAHWTEGLTQAEIYPEAEYMPPRHLTRPQYYDPPLELDGLMDASELAEKLSRPQFISAWASDGYQEPVKDHELSLTPPTDSEVDKQRQDIIDSLPVIQPKIAEDELYPSQVVVKRTATSTSSLRTALVGSKRPTAGNGSTIPTSRVRATPTTTSRSSSVKSTTSAPALRTKVLTTAKPPSTRPASTPSSRISTVKSTRTVPVPKPTSSSTRTPHLHPALQHVEKDELSALLEKQMSLMEGQDELDLGQDET